MQFKARIDGVEGFFEEIPSLIVIIIAMSIFFTSALNFYGSYESSAATVSLIEENIHIMNCVISLSNISHKDSLGNTVYGFSARSLDNFSTLCMKENIHTDMKYNVTIEDLKSGKIWTFGDRFENFSEEKSSLSKAVPIYDDDECHCGKITVVVWK